MRTTIRIDDELYREIKAKAARAGRPVAELIEEAVRASLRPVDSRRGKPRRLRTFGGSATMPGVDLTSASSLLDTMEEGEAVVARR